MREKRQCLNCVLLLNSERLQPGSRLSYSCGMSRRNELVTLKRLIAEADLILATTRP